MSCHVCQSNCPITFPLPPESRLFCSKQCLSTYIGMIDAKRFDSFMKGVWLIAGVCILALLPDIPCPGNRRSRL